MLALATVAVDSPAQERRVREIPDDQLTAEALIEALTPPGEVPPEFRARSLSSPKVDCAFYRKQRDRGIGVEPQTDPVAISVHFDFDSDQLTEDASEKLDALGTALTTQPLVDCCFELEGHTDDVGTDAYNQGLSERRTESVVLYLRENFGVDPDRLLTHSYGEERPIAGNGTEDGRRRNRRVEIATLGYGSAGS
jgi:outer membrane protein OmpA-like peptidoglycan-associated protein